MRVRIQHRTRYIYDGPAALGPHTIRLCPAAHTRAKVLSYALDVAPKGELKWQRDPHANQIARLTFPVEVEVRALELTVDAVFDIRPVNPFDFFLDERARELPFAYPDGLDVELAPFLLPQKAPQHGPRFAALAASLPPTGYVIDYLARVAAAVRQHVDYVLRDEPGVWTSEETLGHGRGSCRDSARLLVDLFRQAGLAARFVSGYLIQLTDEGNLPDEQKGVLQDVVDLHAWCEVFVPGAGWIGLDGTSGLFCNEGHIPLACTVLPEHAAAIEGTADRPAVRFEFAMNIARLGHEFRPRVPYTDETWGDILAAGDAVDAALKAAGLHLTMGGEPTYTSRAHAKLPEWNGDALGDTKAIAGRRLALQLLDKLGAGGVVVERQGKHYPGESLPRWALELLWRGDGAPLWQRPQLLDRGTGARRLATNASSFVSRLAQELGLGAGAAPLPAYEDPWVFIAREALLPDDADALHADLESAESRRTLARVLGRGLGKAVGYALPVARDAFDAAWVGGAWTFRRGKLFLLPGDSPMGLRLPLDRIGGVPPQIFERDTTARPSAFVVKQSQFAPRSAASGSAAAASTAAPFAASADGSVMRTALCVEERNDALYVFMPPLPSADAFVSLIAAIENTAAALDQPVRLEGYGPPSDPRMKRCAVTPDPGVLEVNLPPTGSFSEYVPLLETVTQCAVAVGLTAEKFQLDGREVGSGGGHHLTLGGATTVESPWLTRPHLIASLLRFTQNHPSLSYLFSGLFVGPTSQAPRIDEARMDSLGELEIALGILERKKDPPPPWFVDRALRNLLVDVTGNTHRTEICIDKLYDPHGVAGRLGLVEMRAFEMPPHERMAAAQMLLVRGIAAAYANEPYRRPLVRWGSELHDRFMLPHFLWRDFDSVLSDLAQRGVYLPPDAYQPFVEHRFPKLGSFTAEDVNVELRVALEPWPVLGEEATAGGTSRYVDSSLERIEVRVDGMTEGRHALVCNGITVPLRATGRASERIAGVRYRAWSAPHSLQPHIGVHHPLRFDLVDTWGRRSLGAATHHVWHPEGRAFNEPPLTAFEAAARRAQRFTTVGHASYPVEPRAAMVDPERPFTLDLRRYS